MFSKSCSHALSDGLDHVVRCQVWGIAFRHNRKVHDCLSKVPAALRGFVAMFIGTKGSKTYRNFVEGHWVYRFFVLQKTL